MLAADHGLQLQYEQLYFILIMHRTIVVWTDQR